jgi:hypothetical protein
MDTAKGLYIDQKGAGLDPWLDDVDLLPGIKNEHHKRQYIDARWMGIRTKIITLMRRHNRKEPISQDYLRTVLTSAAFFFEVGLKASLGMIRAGLPKAIISEATSLKSAAFGPTLTRSPNRIGPIMAQPGPAQR